MIDYTISILPVLFLQMSTTFFSSPGTKPHSNPHPIIFDVSLSQLVEDVTAKRERNRFCMPVWATQGTHGVKSTAVILSTCFKPAGCQPEMSSKPNLIDIMPYTAASSNEESKNFMDEQNRSSYEWSVFKSGV